MGIECYLYVMYLVSCVEGRFCEDRDCLDVLVVCFLVGTVLGVLKI